MTMTNADVERYIDDHTSEVNEVLRKIERETYLKSIYPRMLSGKLQGRFLTMLSNMIRPRYILEIGTFTGYSAICLAEGLADDGLLHTIELNKELQDQNEHHFRQAGVDKKIVTHFGNAVEIIPELGIQFDLVFIDADKINYPHYYKLSMEKLRTGGFIIADNVLWGGKVVNEDKQITDKDTLAVIEFNDLVQNDPCSENVMIPLRDGLTLIQKVC